mmetsp:Transcript_65431/g.170294  ORF Transcript_65431/g.170294 Transcript_65431/m.170294 type:complete len:244 (-) Transcript_65431:218-949(-)
MPLARRSGGTSAAESVGAEGSSSKSSRPGGAATSAGWRWCLRMFSRTFGSSMRSSLFRRAWTLDTFFSISSFITVYMCIRARSLSSSPSSWACWMLICRTISRGRGFSAFLRTLCTSPMMFIFLWSNSSMMSSLEDSMRLCMQTWSASPSALAGLSGLGSSATLICSCAICSGPSEAKFSSTAASRAALSPLAASSSSLGSGPSASSRLSAGGTAATAPSARRPRLRQGPAGAAAGLHRGCGA